MSLVWIIVIAVAQYSMAKQNYPLQNSLIQHETGCAYISLLLERPLASPFTDYVGDSPWNAHISRLLLLEDGKVIGQPHVSHDKIRTNGMGNYSHWGNSLYFSASDCSDPRTNGRHYEVVMQSTLTQWAYASWFVAAIGVLLILDDLYSFGLFRKINKILNALLVPVNASQRPLLAGTVLFILLIYAWGYLMSIWESGSTINPLALGWYQVSDSSSYWLCSNSVLDVGNFEAPGATGTNEWCQRRSIYPTFLSGIILIAQRNIFATLLIQALITCTAIYIIVRRSANFVGYFGALLCTVLLFKYAMVDVFALTMTENAGLIFGCVGLAMLLVAAGRKNIAWMAAGIAMISIAMNARAGAFFILPFLVLWAGATAHLSRKKVWQWIGVSIIAMLAGFVLQAMLVLAVGGSPGNTHGNFSYTLYGLSVGGKGWQQVLTDHPEVMGPDAQMSKAIYALAWQNISSQPLVFLQGMEKNFSLLITMGTYGFEKLGTWAPLFTAGWWLAWIPLLINRRNPVYLLVGLSSLGIALSAPLLLGDGGARVFAASVAVDVLQMSIGLSWVGIVFMQGIKRALQVTPILSAYKDSMSNRVTLETGFVIFLLLLLLIPHTPLRHFQNPKPVKVVQCVNDEYSVVTRIGSGGAMLLDFVADDHPIDFFKGEVKRDVFLGRLSPSLWWYEQIKNFTGNSLLFAYQQDRTDLYAPGPYPVYSDQHLTKFDGHTVQLCIDKQVKQTIFDLSYRKLNSIKALD